MNANRHGVVLPALPYPTPLPEVVLFAFDRWAFPFTHFLEMQLSRSAGPRTVLTHGEPGSADEILQYYGSVIRIGETFHMWYSGIHEPMSGQGKRKDCSLCYATSRDGVTWTKPRLGLVGHNGSTDNNVCDFPDPELWSTAAVLHDPDDPDPDRRFKLAYEAIDPHGSIVLRCATSPDGLRWRTAPIQPADRLLEVAGIARFRGKYHINGQGELNNLGRSRARRLETWVSEDFVHWSPCGALGLDRASDLTGPSSLNDDSQYEEVHLGAALWNRGNVLVGVYGQWHGHFSGDRRLVVLDLGLAISHDGMHFHEPIPGFRLIAAREQPDSAVGVFPALQQGQGMENFEDRTLYWFGQWHGIEGSGVRLVSWERDRLGALKAYSTGRPQAITCPIQLVNESAVLALNVSGLGPHSALKVSLLSDGFRPLPGYSQGDAIVVGENGLRVPVRWKSGLTLPATSAPFRFQVEFEGVRPEDASLHAMYVTAADHAGAA